MGERCGWCGSDPLYVDYHDHEWGMPERDPRALFEKLDDRRIEADRDRTGDLDDEPGATGRSTPAFSGPVAVP